MVALDEIARLDDLIAAARIQERRRISRLELEVARGPFDRFSVRAGGVFPPPVALVKIRQRHIEPWIVRHLPFQPRDRVGVPSGAGVSFRAWERGDVSLTPVVEVVGWTALGGKETASLGDNVFEIFEIYAPAGPQFDVVPDE